MRPQTSHRNVATPEAFILLVMFIVVEKTVHYSWCLGVDEELQRIRSVADYQFGKGVGIALFPKRVKIEYSRNTGRIRYVYLDGERLATLRPTDGLFSLSIKGASRILEKKASARYVVAVRNDVSEIIKKGGDVFAAHVIKVDESIRARDEVIVTDENGSLLAVGRVLLCAAEMKAFKRGIAVKTRRGCNES
ncbi:MAG: pseudouridine synthase [Candidatus Bathyarchaeota archaeon]|nr:pseudouridine synthase [Candidatus Bathyarchaeota archaeon]